VRRPDGPDALSLLSRAAAEGFSRVPAGLRRRNVRHLHAAQNADGGFSGRRGGSDLYYTTFALRTAVLLGVDEAAFWQRAGEYLIGRGRGLADVADCHSLLDGSRCIELSGARPDWPPAETAGAWRAAVEHMLTACRAPAGGYCGRPGGTASVYHTYLAALCHGLLGEPMPGPDAALAMVRSRRRPDGGFSDLPAARDDAAGGVNPTAAAVQLLAMHGALDDETSAAAAAFVAAAQRPDGGFAAWPGAPCSDLLSTFTALVTLFETDAVASVKLAPVARFIGGLRLRDGGFRGTAADVEPDLEYTYYGLASLGFLGWQALRAEGERRHARC